MTNATVHITFIVSIPRLPRFQKLTNGKINYSVTKNAIRIPGFSKISFQLHIINKFDLLQFLGDHFSVCLLILTLIEWDTGL